MPPFPLPLTPFERYYWHDDRPEYPTAYAFELTFRGRLERECLERALATVLGRHPLLTARVADTKAGPAWVPGTNAPLAIDWADAPAPICHPDGPRINLAHSPGIRPSVRVADETTLLRLQIHHACADGLAALRVIEDVLVAYHACCQAPLADPPLPPLALEALRDRGRLATPEEEAAYTTAAWLRDQVAGAAEWSRHVLRPAAPLASPGTCVAPPAEEPPLAFDAATLDEGEVTALRQLAAGAGATWNDLLLAEWFRTLARWNARLGRRRGTLRLNVPVSLRPPNETWFSACNRLTFAFVDCPASWAFRDDLVARVQSQTQQIKHHRLGHFFVGGLELGFYVPGLVPALLRRDVCFATAVLSNVGRVLAKAPLPRGPDGRLLCGAAVLLRIAAAPPVRPLTRAALAVMQYAGEATFSLRVDPRALSRADGQSLLADYLDRLRELAASRQPAESRQVA